ADHAQDYKATTNISRDADRPTVRSGAPHALFNWHIAGCGTAAFEWPWPARRRCRTLHGTAQRGGMAMEYSAIGFEQAEGVATITLNRPEAFNSLNQAMAQELFDAAHRCDADPAIRAVLITGAGRAFCGGGDLKSFAAQPDVPRHLKEVTTYLHGAVSRLARSDK